ncbi:MAG: SRPBCC family protein [Acidimicrobiales bacterium]
MGRVEATVIVDVDLAVAFAVSQTQGPIRYRWDTFVRRQELVDADRPAPGVRTVTRSRHGLRMVSEYTSFRPPTHVGMRMVEGPWFFRSFGGGWSFRALDDGRTQATWRYTFAVRPGWLSHAAEPIGRWLLQRDIDRRITGFASGCADPVVVAAATAPVRTEPKPAAGQEGRRQRST